MFKHSNNNVSLAQLIERQTVDQEISSSNPGWGEFFSLKFLLMRKCTKWRTRTRTTTTQVIPWPMAADKNVQD